MASSTGLGGYDRASLDDDLIDPDDAVLNDLDDPLETTQSRQPLAGNIGSSSSAVINESYLSSHIPGEDRRAPQNTIDESVWETLRRDLVAVWAKLKEVLYPRYILGGSMIESSGGLLGAYSSLREAGLTGARNELAGLAGRVVDPEALLSHNNMSPGLRNWDLWGPLIFCLLLSLLISFSARPDQKDLVFTSVFALIWLGEAVVTLQIRLLGGSISFAQSVSVIGYTLFPLVIAALLSVLPHSIRLSVVVRIPIDILLVVWSLAAGASILSGSGVVKNRVGLAIYPLFVFYLGLGFLCLIGGGG